MNERDRHLLHLMRRPGPQASEEYSVDRESAGSQIEARRILAALVLDLCRIRRGLWAGVPFEPERSLALQKLIRRFPASRSRFMSTLFFAWLRTPVKGPR